MTVSSQCRSDGCVVYIIGYAYCQDIGYPTSNNTWAANWEQHVSPTQPNTQKGSKANHFTQKQKFLHQSILTNFGFTSASIPVTLNDFENPSLARLCLGLRLIGHSQTISVYFVVMFPTCNNSKEKGKSE